MTARQRRFVFGLASAFGVCVAFGAFAMSRVSLGIAELASGASAWLGPDSSSAQVPLRDESPTPPAAPQEVARALSEVPAQPHQPEPLQPEPVQPEPLQPCEGEIRLLGAVVNTTRPPRSLAALGVRGGTRILRVGQRVAGMELIALRSRRAYLRDAAGRVCELRVSAASAPAAALAPKSVKRNAPRGLSAEALAKGIRTLGPDRFAVTRELLNEALGNVSALRRGARYRLVKRDGKVAGLAIAKLRPNTALSALGLQEGDVVRNLNGVSLSEPTGALEALKMVRSQSEFTLAVERKGAPRTLAYVVE